MLLLLPVILYSDGYTISKRYVSKNKKYIIMSGIFGTMWNIMFFYEAVSYNKYTRAD